MKHNQMAWKAIEDELKKVNLQLRLLYLSHPGGDANELPGVISVQIQLGLSLYC